MKIRTVFSAVALISLVACGHEPSGTTSSTSATTPTETTAKSPNAGTANYDVAFIDTMSQHHQLAIQMATAAQQKVRMTELKELTRRIPQDQQKEIDQMKAWREQWYPNAPAASNTQMPGMSSSMNMDTGHLSSMKPGPAYDAMFIDMMIPHHEGAVQMAKDALQKGEHPELKTLAQQIIDKQQKEIDDMRRWKSKLGS